MIIGEKNSLWSLRKDFVNSLHAVGIFALLELRLIDLIATYNIYSAEYYLVNQNHYFVFLLIISFQFRFI